MEKVTNKTIEQETILLPYIIAQTIAETAVATGMKPELDKWNSLNAEQRKDLDERYKKEVQSVEDYLVLRANTTFQYNTDFRKKVKGSGNKGRDYLYVFMNHWAGIHEGHATVPNSYKRGMENYYKAIELHDMTQLVSKIEKGH